MRWHLALAVVLAICTLLVAADRRPPSHAIEKRLFTDKTHNKRGVPLYSKGYDIPIVRHSLLKPFLVKYPMQSVSLGVKIPLKNPNFQHQAAPQAPPRVPHATYGVPAAQKPTQLHPMAVRPAASNPVTPCPIPVTPALRPIAPVASFVPIIPTTTIQAAPVPALTPVLPLPHPPISFLPKPVLKPFHPVPFAPVPVLPAATPAVLKPGNSLHTSFFATFPRHPLVPAVAPAVHYPLHKVPVHQIHPVNVFPSTVPLHAPVVPVNVAHHIHKFPVHPINVIPPDIPVHAPIPVAPTLAGFPNVPLGVGELPASLAPHHHFVFQKPGLQFEQQPQEQNFHGFHAIGNHDNQWTPMTTTSTVAQFPVAPDQQNFLGQEGGHVEQSQTYHYSNPDTSFFDGNEQQQQQQSHFEQHFGNVHQEHHFGNVNQEHHHFGNVQQEQHFGNVQQEQHFDNIHQEQHFGNVQHEPQLPQALPEHQPINEAYQNHFPLRQHLPLTGPSENFAGYQ